METHTTKPFFFLAFANDAKNNLFQLPKEIRDIKTILDRASHLCEHRTEPSITSDELHRVISLRKEDISVFHFGGHTDNNQALLNNDNNETSLFGKDGIVGLLKQLPNLVLVFINGCESEQIVNELYEAGHTCRYWNNYQNKR